jgi:ABC-2 type transport system permease protein
MAAEVLRQDLARKGYGSSAFQPVDLRVRTWYNPTLRVIVGYAPALFAMVMGLPGTLVMATLAQEKEHGTMEQLIATPISRTELLVGKLIPYLLSGLVSVLICTGIVVYWFRVPFRGSILVFMLLSADFLLATIGFGLLLSVFVETQQAAQILGHTMFTIPTMFLSGIFVPISSMNPVMQVGAYVFPSTHYVIIARQLFLKGWGTAQLWPYAIALLMMGLFFVAITVMLFRKKMR